MSKAQTVGMSPQAEDDSIDDSSVSSSPVSSSSFLSSSSDEQQAEHDARNRNSNGHSPSRRPARPSRPIPRASRSSPSPPASAPPFPPDSIPPLSALPRILRYNLSFTSEYGPFRMCLGAFFLGCCCMLGVLLAVVCPLGLRWNVGAFVTVWAAFHWMEFVMTAVFHPGSLSFTAFLLNHSRAFHLALLSSVVEHCVELLLFPSLKTSRSSLLVAACALPCVLVAQCLRSLSMYQCSTNFSHVISPHREPSHHLITGGLYSVSRHPSYTAWYAWSVLTQLLLVNPVCSVGYAVAGWRFFASRIDYEEARLLSFFGKEYRQYQRTVWSGIPLLTTRGEREARADH